MAGAYLACPRPKCAIVSINGFPAPESSSRRTCCHGLKPRHPVLLFGLVELQHLEPRRA